MIGPAPIDRDGIDAGWMVYRYGAPMEIRSSLLLADAIQTTIAADQQSPSANGGGRVEDA